MLLLFGKAGKADRLQAPRNPASGSATALPASTRTMPPNLLGYDMSSELLPVATLGVPRIGRRRELKFALESYWAGKSSADDLLNTAKALRAASWREQAERGVTRIPSNDFSLYDHVLDTAVMVGALPAAYGWTDGPVSLDTYFAMARGGEGGLTALEMTKWFDTNYHYMVPELVHGQNFTLASTKPIDEFLEAKALGIHTRPVLLGPVTFLKLAKARDGDFEPMTLLKTLMPVYVELLGRLKEAGADWVQIDEPTLVLDLTAEEREAFRSAYGALAVADTPEILVATYFGPLGDNLDTAVSLPVGGLHVDCVRAPEQLEQVVTKAPSNWVLSLGVIDGRNIWRTDLAALRERLENTLRGTSFVGIELAPSSSLLHVPIDLDLETALDPELKSWLAFAVQKMSELWILASALSRGEKSVWTDWQATADALQTRAISTRVHDASVAARTAAVDTAMEKRVSPFAERSALQHDRLKLPFFPTTTIGSFPQTAEVRKARAAHARGEMNDADYAAFLRARTAETIRWQEEIGLDVLVHGEFERNDMVQYFGERLSGFAFTKHAWVQSYGSRYVRPPIIFGDVSRPAPMTVGWWRYAQSCTDKPMKGMLTGPVTILNWSFVRDDLPRADVCRQIALAIRDEVLDLEKAGAAMIQIDEAALREGLPLRKSDWQTYLDWAVESFRLTSSGVRDETQIHTHMCYSEFNDIIESIAAMDADVISIETSRSRMELLDAFREFDYPNEIGPGVYDIHSPRVPTVVEMVDLLEHARKRLADRQIWVNPDCGLKTRKWDEVRPALVNMVAAAARLRAEAVVAA